MNRSRVLLGMTAFVLTSVLASGHALDALAQPAAKSHLSQTNGPRSGPTPAADRVPAKAVHHGVEVIDEYQWLENWDDAKVKSWSDDQNAYARAFLDNLPGVERIRDRITEIEKSVSVAYLGWAVAGNESTGLRVFALKRDPAFQQPLLVVMDSVDHPDTARVVVDPNTIDEHGHAAIDWFIPSPDGALVAVSLSSGGSESGDLHIFNTDTGKRVEDPIARVNGGTAGGSMAWLPDNSGFYYTRYPRAGERPAEDLDFYMQVYRHTIGTPESADTYEMGKDLARISEIQLQLDAPTGRVLASVQYGDGGEFSYYMKQPDGVWSKFLDHDDEVVQAVFGKGDSAGDLFLLTTKDSPRVRVLRMNAATLDLKNAKTIIAQGADVIVPDFWPPSPVVVTDHRLYLTYQLGGPSEIRAFDHSGNPQKSPTVLPVSAVNSIKAIPGTDDIIFDNRSFIDAPACYHFSSAGGTTRKTALAAVSPVDFSDTEVIREFAISKDGTKVPVNIIKKKSVKLDGTNPTILWGYGGYGVNIQPAFSAVRRLWIENGGVFAVANIRGGGEYGEEWHRQGMLTKKQNCFDDFAAAARHLVTRAYTNPDRLAIMGGSNGGLLMGATITQNPDICRAVVSSVGIYDMLRVELSANGAFNIPEFGTVTNPEQFRALYAYSPYHHVKEGVRYPSVIFLTGANDPRVDPMQSRKMTASMQRAISTVPSANPILLRTSANTGHGMGTPLNARIEEQTDTYAFLFNELGMWSEGEGASKPKATEAKN